MNCENILNIFNVLKNITNVAVIKCPGLENGTNTVYVPDSLSDGLIYQESYTYSCMEGYTTTDELCTVCQPDGTLSLTKPPNCTGKSHQKVYKQCSLR